MLFSDGIRQLHLQTAWPAVTWPYQEAADPGGADVVSGDVTTPGATGSREQGLYNGGEGQVIAGNQWKVLVYVSNICYKLTTCN